MKILKRILLAAVCAILLAGLTMNLSSCSLIAIYAITRAITESRDENPVEEATNIVEYDTFGDVDYPLHLCCYDQENTDYRYLCNEATCTEPMRFYYSCKCGELSWDTTFEVGEPKGHVYDRQVPDAAYYIEGNKYYYSCECGAVGEEVFYMGGEIVEPPQYDDGYTIVSKTVFGLCPAYVHTTPDTGKNYCGEIDVAYVLYVEATDGEWYKIQGTMFGYEYVYVRCEDVTEDYYKVCFQYVNEGVTASVKEGIKVAYLCRGLNEGDYVAGLYSGRAMDVIAMNETGDWALVCYVGWDDLKGFNCDGSIYYYCPTYCLNIYGLY